MANLFKALAVALLFLSISVSNQAIFASDAEGLFDPTIAITDSGCGCEGHDLYLYTLHSGGRQSKRYLQSYVSEAACRESARYHSLCGGGA